MRNHNQSLTFLTILIVLIRFPGIPLYKDIVTIDKRKIAEEVDNLPKPDHLLDAEKELLSFKSVKA